MRVVKLCQGLDEKPGVSRTLANQLWRSGTSVGANLEESKGGQSRADFLSKVSISLKEARETYYWLRLRNAADIRSERQLAPLLDEANQIVAILTVGVAQNSVDGAFPAIDQARNSVDQVQNSVDEAFCSVDLVRKDVFLCRNFTGHKKGAPVAGRPRSAVSGGLDGDQFA